jgi:hypothetical protein
MGLRLSGDLEFSRLDNFSTGVAYMINVNTTVKFIQGNGEFCRYVRRLVHFLAEQTTVNIEGKSLLEILLQIERNIRCSRVGIQLNDPVLHIRNRGCSGRLALRLNGNQQNKGYYR